MSAMEVACWRTVCDRCGLTEAEHHESKRTAEMAPMPKGWGVNQVGWDMCPACMAQATGQDTGLHPGNGIDMTSDLDKLMEMTPDELMANISAALRDRDLKAAAAFMRLLEVKDPVSYALITRAGLERTGGDHG